MNFVEELRWRGMIHDIMPGTEELLSKEMTTAYVGIDPTASSIHIGHLVSMMMLKHFQRCGHRPVVLVGGATGMIGDPSGKSQERNLLDEPTLRHNQECIKKQLARFLDFSTDKPNAALMVNNYDWMKEYSFLGFIRDIGKHITVNYMMSKDSVKKRLSGDAGSGLSFTEFSYQLVQGTDFLHLYQTLNCKLQMGGSDQWGNIVTGTELIRRKLGGEAYALTCPLMTKSDGGKFGENREGGNVWLDPNLNFAYTSFSSSGLMPPNEDAEKYIKIFTTLDRDTIESLIKEHKEAPHLRKLQKVLAREVTIMVHSEADYRTAVDASEILFGNSTSETLRRIDENTFLSVFEGVPLFDIEAEILVKGVPFSELATENCGIFHSKGDLRRTVQGGGVSVNKEKVSNAEMLIDSSSLINGKYIIVQKGKKNYSLIRVKQ